MLNQFFFIYPNSYSFATLPSLSHLHGYGCQLYTFHQMLPIQSIQPSREIQSYHASEQYSFVKEEEISSKQQSQTLNKSFSKFKYAKKNVQSNVINQCFSYLTSKAKSYSLLVKILKTEQKIDAFYQIMKQGKKNNTKYMGRNILQNLLALEDDHPVYILHKKLRLNAFLKISQIRYALRILTSYFLKKLIVPTILTSSKMDRTTLKHHLTRAREIQRFLNQTSTPYL